MSRVNDQPAFILHRRDFRDSSLLLEVFTAHYGRLTLLARGARKRRDNAHFQPLNRLSVSWSGRGEMKTLVNIDSRPISVPRDCYLAALYVNELLMYLLPAQDEYEAVFLAYQNLLLQINRDALEIQLRDFEIHLMSELGLMPDLLHECEEGRPVADKGWYRVDMHAGVMAVHADAPGGYRGYQLKAIHAMNLGADDNRRAARRLMREIIDFNLHGRTLQSRQLYKRTQQTRMHD